jgi:hypothetical protein
MALSYRRETRTTTLAALPPALHEALAAHVRSSQLTVDGDAPAYLTRNERQGRRGLLGPRDPDPEHFVALVIGDRDVLIGVHGEQRGTAVLACRLERATVGSSPLRVGGEGGVSVKGFPTTVDGHTTEGSFYVGLGAPDAEAARAALTEAVRAAKAR